jgi:aminopeptidase
MLNRRCDYLNKKQYYALKFTSNRTNLTIGLPKDHIWHGGDVISQAGINFTPNLPTEEIFTLPDKNRVDGFVKTTRPIFYQGLIIDECMFKFSNGKIIEAMAKIGDDLLQKTIKIDEGARMLGEVALVPHSSPISQTGLLFYNILIDENAASHIALGKAYKNSLKDGGILTDEEFSSAGGNSSLIHLDMMIGSEDMNVDGITKDGEIDPIMKNGEWVFRI